VRHFIMHTRRASHGIARPLNCGVMRHKIYAAVILLVALPIAAQSYNSAFPSGKRFVLALANGAELFQQCSRDAPRGVTDFWAPTEAELDQLEADLIKELDARTGGLGMRNGEQPPRGFEYHRQYVGFVRNGTRYIYGNFYPGGDLARYEHTRAVTICDGGSAWWGVVYIPAFRRFREFSFNGIT
jgi:hypothetical protein